MFPRNKKRALRDDKSRPGLHENTKFGSRYPEIGVEHTHSQAWNPAWTGCRVACFNLWLLIYASSIGYFQPIIIDVFYLERRKLVVRLSEWVPPTNHSRCTQIKNPASPPKLCGILDDCTISNNFQQMTFKNLKYSKFAGISHWEPQSNCIRWNIMEISQSCKNQNASLEKRFFFIWIPPGKWVHSFREAHDRFAHLSGQKQQELAEEANWQKQIEVAW